MCPGSISRQEALATLNSILSALSGRSQTVIVRDRILGFVEIHLPAADSREPATSAAGAQIAQAAEGAGSTAGRLRCFSPMEEDILQALTEKWQSAKDLAKSSGHSFSGSFQAVCTNLAECGYAESSNRGYRRSSGPLLPTVDDDNSDESE